MARVAPASWSFWAMPHAMERLLANPKTTAVLPAKLIMLLWTLHRGNDGDAAAIQNTRAIFAYSGSAVTVSRSLERQVDSSQRRIHPAIDVETVTPTAEPLKMRSALQPPSAVY